MIAEIKRVSVACHQLVKAKCNNLTPNESWKRFALFDERYSFKQTPAHDKYTYNIVYNIVYMVNEVNWVPDRYLFFEVNFTGIIWVWVNIVEKQKITKQVFFQFSQF